MLNIDCKLVSCNDSMYICGMKELIEKIEKLSKEERSFLIVHLLSVGIIDYKDVSDGYIEWLRNVRKSDVEKTRTVGNALLNVIIGKKKEISESIKKAYDVLEGTGMFNLNQNILKKWK